MKKLHELKLDSNLLTSKYYTIKYGYIERDTGQKKQIYKINAYFEEIDTLLNTKVIEMFEKP